MGLSVRKGGLASYYLSANHLPPTAHCNKSGVAKSLCRVSRTTATQQPFCVHAKRLRAQLTTADRRLAIIPLSWERRSKAPATSKTWSHYITVWYYITLGRFSLLLVLGQIIACVCKRNEAVDLFIHHSGQTQSGQGVWQRQSVFAYVETGFCLGVNGHAMIHVKMSLGCACVRMSCPCILLNSVCQWISINKRA